MDDKFFIDESEDSNDQFFIDETPEREYSGWSDVPASVAKTTLGGLKNTAGGLLSAIEDTGKYLAVGDSPIANFMMKLGGMDDYTYGENLVEEAQKTLKDTQEQYQFEPWSGSSIANRVGSGVGQMAPIVVGGALTGGTGVIPMIGAQTFGTSYGNAQAEGQSSLDSAYRAMGNAGVDMLAGRANLNAWFKPELGVVRKVIESSLVNAVTDPFQNIANQRINEATGADHVNVEDLNLGESALSSAITGAILPTATHYMGKQMADMGARRSQAEVDAIKAKMDQFIPPETLDVKTSLPPSEADIPQLSRPLADSGPRIIDIQQEQPSGILPVESSARTPDYQAELDAMMRPQTQLITDAQGRPFNATPQEPKPIVAPFTQKGEVRAALPTDEKAIIKELKLAETQRKNLEAKALPAVVEPKPAQSLSTNKAINNSSFPKVMEYVQKNMSDKGAQEGFINALRTQREAIEQGVTPEPIPDPKVEATKQIEAIKQQEMPAEDAQPNQSRSMLEGHSTVDLPTKLIQLSKDVPNFKSGANERGVVDGEELKSLKYDRLGTAPIVVWQRNDGSFEVISGRHRLDLAKRLGEETIPSQVVKESDGFTANMASVLDAELNIRDGNGKISDYATYFKETGLTEGEASARGLLSRAKGIQGFDIGTKSSPELSALYNSGKINDARAAAIARGAPNNSDIQRAGIAAHLDRPTTPEALESLTRRLAEDPSIQSVVTGEQGGLFGGNDGAISRVQNEARVSGIMAQEIQKKITAAYDAAKNPKLAKEMGVDAKDPEGTLKRITELKAAKDKWVDHWKYPELKEEMATRVAEYEKEQKASTLKNVKKSLKGQRGAVINPFFKQKDAIKAITQNMEDVELQKAVQTFGRNVETQVESVRKLGIEKSLESEIRRWTIFPQTIAQVEKTFQAFIDTAKRGRELSMTIAHDLLQKGSAFIQQPNVGRMWEYAAAAREKGSAFQWTAENFQKIGATESEVKGLMALRDTMDSALPIYRDVLIKQGIEPEKAQVIVDEMQKSNYVPFSRFGDKFVQLNDPATGEQVYFAKFETDKQKNAALARIEALKKQYPDKQLQVREGDFGENPESLFAANSANGFQQHLKPAQNVPGYQKNMKRAVSEYIGSLANFAAKAEMKMGFEQAYEALPKNSPKLAKYAQEYAQYQMSNEGEGSTARKVMTLWFLAGRVSSGVLNLTQQLTTTLPRAQAEVGTVKATQYWANSRKLLVERLIGGEASFAKKYPELDEAINTALKHGSISEQSLRELGGRARSQTGEVSGFDQVMDVGMFFFDAAEKSNRYHAFLTGYQIAKERGMSPQAATRYGEQFSDVTQFDYSKINRPKAARGKIGAPLSTFQLYKFNDIKFTFDLAKAALKGDGKAAQGLATKIGIMVALAGLAGAVPGTKEINKALESAGYDVRGSVRTALKDQKFLADMLDNGLPYAFGLPDISGSLSNEVLSLPTDFNAEGVAGTIGKVVGGVPLAMAGKVAETARLASQGEYMKAFQAGAPASLSAMAKAFEAASEGKVTNTRGQTIAKDPSLGEVGSMALGFTPSRSRKFYNDSRSLQIFDENAKDNDDINKKIAEARINKDRAEESRLRQAHAAKQKERVKQGYGASFPNPKAINDFILSMQDPIAAQMKRLKNSAKPEAQRRFGSSSLGGKQ